MHTMQYLHSYNIGTLKHKLGGVGKATPPPPQVTLTSEPEIQVTLTSESKLSSVSFSLSEYVSSTDSFSQA